MLVIRQSVDDAHRAACILNGLLRVEKLRADCLSFLLYPLDNLRNVGFVLGKKFGCEDCRFVNRAPKGLYLTRNRKQKQDSKDRSGHDLEHVFVQPEYVDKLVVVSAHA